MNKKHLKMSRGLEISRSRRLNALSVNARDISFAIWLLKRRFSLFDLHETILSGATIPLIWKKGRIKKEEEGEFPLIE